jgi:putative membrane protein
VLNALAPIAVAAHWEGPVVGGFGFLFLLIPLFWIGVIVLIASLGRRRWRREGWGQHEGWSTTPSRSAETSLAERFAQGDIDEKEYRARLEVLRANQHPQPQAR